MASCCAVARVHNKKNTIPFFQRHLLWVKSVHTRSLFQLPSFTLFFWSVFCISPAEERGPPCLALTGSGFAGISRPPHPSPLLCLFFSVSPKSLIARISFWLAPFWVKDQGQSFSLIAVHLKPFNCFRSAGWSIFISWSRHILSLTLLPTWTAGS